MISSLLRTAALTIHEYDRDDHDDIVPRSLQSSGAVALFLGEVNTNHICILGCWRSDVMFRYFHNRAMAYIKDSYHILFQGEHYTVVTQRRP